jgi:hypothetical protein
MHFTNLLSLSSALLALLATFPTPTETRCCRGPRGGFFYTCWDDTGTTPCVRPTLPSPQPSPLKHEQNKTTNSLTVRLQKMQRPLLRLQGHARNPSPADVPVRHDQGGQQHGDHGASRDDVHVPLDHGR